MIVKPSGQPVRLRRDNPITRELVFYLPLTEGGGNQIVDVATRTVGEALSGVATTWTHGAPGVAYDIPEITGFPRLRYLPFRNPSQNNGVIGQTIGALVKFQNKGAVNAKPASLIVGYNNNTHTRIFFSANGTVTEHLRGVYLEPNSIYAQCSTGQFAAGEIRTIFFRGIQGGSPTWHTALWPSGSMAEPTYNARAGTIPYWTIGPGCEPFGLDQGGAHYGPCCVWWLGMWGRTLDLAEMNSLHKDPWQMIEPLNASTDFTESASIAHAPVGDDRLAII